MEDGVDRGKLDSDGSGKFVVLDLRFGLFKGHGKKMHAGADGLADAVGTEEAGAVGKKRLESARVNQCRFMSGAEAAIPGDEESGLGGKTPATVERELSLGALLEVHLCPMRGQVVEGALKRDGKKIARVE